MRLDPFKLERYLARYEFTAPHQLSCSDCDGLEMSELLSLADGESRQLWDSLALGYTEAPGHPLLRAEIAGLYGGVGADDVLVAAPEELIFLAVNSIVRNGDHVVCTFPAYQSLYQIAEGMHCEVTFWEADEKQGWRFEPARLAEMIRPSTRLIVVNFPHNPTGALPSRDDFDAVVEIARRHNLTLLCDEMYRQLEFDESTRLPAAAEVYERAVSLSGMSKVYGLAGARIGWVVSRDSRLLKRMLTLKDYTTICAGAPSEILSLMALRAGQPIVERHIGRIRRNLALLSAFIAKYPNLFAWNPPVAGTVCLPRVLPETLRAEALCQAAVTEAGVVLVPSSVFDFGDRHVRFGLGREAFPDALDAFDAFLTSKTAGETASGPTAAQTEPPVEPPVEVPVEPLVEPSPEPPPVEPLVESSPEPPVAPSAERPADAPAGPPVDGLPLVEPAAVPVTPEPPAVESPAAPPAVDALSDFAVELEPSLTAPTQTGESSPWDDTGGSATPEDEDATAYFPASARDAHPEHESVVDDVASAAPAVAAADSEPPTPEEAGGAAFSLDEEAREPDAPDLPPGVERGQGMPLDFFDEPDETGAAMPVADEPPEIEVVSPGDIAPEAVFVTPSTPADDDETLATELPDTATPAVEPPASAPAVTEPPASAPPPTEPAAAAPPAEETPSGSSETIEPPPGSWGIIPPPDGTPGS